MGGQRKVLFGQGRRSKAQTSIEVLLILGVGILVLAVLTSMVYDSIFSNYSTQQQREGYAAVNSLVKEIKDVYFLGPGTVREVVIWIPKGADLANSSIIGESVVLRLNGSDLVATADINLVGEWPNNDGSSVFVVSAFDGYVSVSSRKISVSPPSVGRVVLHGGRVDENIRIENYDSDDLEYSVILEMPYGISGEYFGGEDFLVVAEGSRSLEFSFSCASDSFGDYSGRIIFVPQNVTDANIYLPVRLECSSVLGRLAIFPASKSISIGAGVSSQESVLVCNNLPSGFLFSSSSISGSVSDFVSTKFFGEIKGESCRKLWLDINAPAQSGSYLGVITVNSGGFSASADLNVVVD